MDWRKRISSACLAAAGMSMLLTTGVAAAAVYEPHTSYRGENLTGLYTELPEAKASWTAVIDRQEETTVNLNGSIAHGDGKVFLLRQGQLTALNAQSGKPVWKFGTGLKLPLIYQDGTVYVSSAAGNVWAVHAASGARKWGVKVPGAEVTALTAEGGQLLVQNGDILAYSLSSGKLEWKDNYSEPLYSSLQIQGDILLAENSVSGAYTYDLMHAFDRKSGKHLWELSDHYLPVAGSDGTLLSQRKANLFDLLPLTTLDTLDARTGKVLKTTEYNPRGIDPKVDGGSGGTAWTDGGNLYINEGPKVYGYPLDADPATVKPKYYSPEGSGAKLSYAAGPYDGRVLFTDGESVYGLKLANQSLVSYYGGGGIARFDLLGHGMYIARTDGRVVAVDLISGKPLLQLKTSGRAYGPVRLEAGMIIVESRGQLTAFKEPAVLKMK
ncbi:PQQ-binding-like beta-propeller repeat protein [Paenibacillus tepidiphilus]|uniref:PQQ-binding-like beta-propeller repeat protein n=1 Tax=Paenibacillus tepidiphilus TaxID=2608683 RepID=UPI00123ADA3F|nr:PQQ-binding-like beta-propeller repeat protein [Paenibacillus tepidiphilus]